MQKPKQLPVLPTVRAFCARFLAEIGRGNRGERWLTGISLTVTLLATAFFLGESLANGRQMLNLSQPWPLIRLGVFVLLVLMLIYGNVVYQLCRLGQLRRVARHDERHVSAGKAEVEGNPLVILVPSYREDLRTIRQTLLSAALQDYPNRRVVLLIDDPIQSQSPEDAAMLAAARRLPEELTSLLRSPGRHIEAAAELFRLRGGESDHQMQGERRRLLTLYREVGAWFARQAAPNASHDHTDALFMELTFLRHHDRIREAIKRIRRDPAGALPDEAAIERSYAQLEALFRVEITSFERKRYANLSHEPNKAANLNAYLGLIGSWATECWNGEQRYLVPGCPEDDHTLSFPDATYVITLDADSLIAPDYASRLVGVMEQPGNERLAVVQTPYTAIPGAPSRLERIAGATTDIQYLIHQGFTAYDATFWVGANALLRKSALDDLREDVPERGFIVPRFIQDSTVIEDTESSIDLVAKEWRLFNYPERLAFSATPPDFGALLIQRRRWANGGLLIFPKLLRHMIGGVRARTLRPLEFLVRAHYLVSIAATSVGLLALLFLPIGTGFDSPWLPLTALPYFVLYTRDLRRIGYRRSDMLRVYAFNMLLLPVNLAGVAKSIQQATAGEKIPFGRTPKTEGRTAAPGWAIAAEYLLLAVCLVIAVQDAAAGKWSHAAFTLVTAAGMLYAIVAFIGIRASFEDLRRSIVPSLDAVGKRLPARRLNPSRMSD